MGADTSGRDILLVTVLTFVGFVMLVCFLADALASEAAERIACASLPGLSYAILGY